MPSREQIRRRYAARQVIQHTRSPWTIIGWCAVGGILVFVLLALAFCGSVGLIVAGA